MKVPDWFKRTTATEPQQRCVMVAGASIHCLCWNLEAPGPSLLLVHGMTASARWWAPIAPLLADNFQVVAIDLSGMGDSDHRPTYDRATQAAEIAAVVRELELSDLAIVAHSFGGIPAAEAVRLNPALARCLVLVDSPVDELGAPLADERWARPRRPHLERETALQRYKLIPPGRHPMPAYVRYIAEHSLLQKANGWHWKFDWKLSSHYLQQPPIDIGAVTIPTWIVHGALSEIQDATKARRLAAMLRHPAGVVAIADAHHHVMIEQPLALAACLNRILAAPVDCILTAVI